MGMLNVILAGDKKGIRDPLKNILLKIPGVNVIDECDNGKQLVLAVQEKRPEMVFTDVDLPEINGLKAAREIIEIDPDIFIVFATGSGSYTYEAFEIHAFDYIIKPFVEARIFQSLSRAKQLKEKNERLRVMEMVYPDIANGHRKIKVQSEGHCFFVNTKEIVFITRDERKTVIHTVNKVIKTYEPMEKLYQRLDRNKFFRCHKGYIINADMVSELAPWGHKTYMVKMDNTGHVVLMTFDKAKEFQDKYCFG
jgi:DNA-binding LytR/AlgR family response regulator